MPNRHSSRTAKSTGCAHMIVTRDGQRIDGHPSWCPQARLCVSAFNCLQHEFFGGRSHSFATHANLFLVL